MAIPVIIISGYLGGGKTTFLRHLLPACGKNGLRPVLIINEAGNIDIDGKLLEDLCAEQISIVDGCICCSKQAEIDNTVIDVVKRNMGDIIIIECSGFSSPLAVLNILSSSIKQGIIEIRHIIGVVDSFRCLRIPILVDLFKEQIATADIVILNKWDTLTDDQRENVSMRINELLKPGTGTFMVNYGEIGENACCAILTGINSRNIELYGGENCNHHSLKLPAGFTATRVSFPLSTSRAELDNFLTKMPSSVIRAKGFVNLNEGWHSVQCVFNSIDIAPFNGNTLDLISSMICIEYQNNDEILDIRN